MTLYHATPEGVTANGAALNLDEMQGAAFLSRYIRRRGIDEFSCDTESGTGAFVDPSVRIEWRPWRLEARPRGSSLDTRGLVARKMPLLDRLEALCRVLDSPTGAPIGPLRLGVTLSDDSVYVQLSRGPWDMLVVSAWDPEPHLSSLPKPTEEPLVAWAKPLAQSLQAADTGDLGHVSILPDGESAETLDGTDIDDPRPYAEPLSIIRNAYEGLTTLVDSLETAP